jgi:aryl-alcohol dehydrogenase-like predicted oxidoreductase
MRDSVITGAIVGARRPAQVDDLLAADAVHLTAEELAQIAALLPPSVSNNIPDAA